MLSVKNVKRQNGVIERQRSQKSLYQNNRVYSSIVLKRFDSVVQSFLFGNVTQFNCSNYVEKEVWSYVIQMRSVCFEYMEFNYVYR